MQLTKRVIKHTHTHCFNKPSHKDGPEGCKRCPFAFPSCLLRNLFKHNEFDWEFKRTPTERDYEALFRAWGLYKIGLHQLTAEQVKKLKRWENELDN